MSAADRFEACRCCDLTEWRASCPLVRFTIAESKIDTKRLSAAAAGSLVLAFTLAKAACGGGAAPHPDPSAPHGTYNNHSHSEHHGQRRPRIYQTMTIPSTIQ